MWAVTRSDGHTFIKLSGLPRRRSRRGIIIKGREGKGRQRLARGNLLFLQGAAREAQLVIFSHQTQHHCCATLPPLTTFIGHFGKGQRGHLRNSIYSLGPPHYSCSLKANYYSTMLLKSSQTFMFGLEAAIHFPYSIVEPGIGKEAGDTQPTHKDLTIFCSLLYCNSCRRTKPF